ncbi:MAG: hypothetical protein M0006_01670 [Magnetospirillum sp.]|nr:hypothetical protein [Magnetospirillum sp.]
MAVAAVVLTGCYRAEPVYEVRNHPIPQAVQAKISPAREEQLITEAAANRNWRVERIAPGQLRATIRIRDKHTAVCDIRYDKTSYSILLVSSENLKQDGEGHIHHTYNSAVHKLEDEIETTLFRAGK